MQIKKLLSNNNGFNGAILLVMISLNAVINDIIMKSFILDTSFSPMAVNGFRIFFSFIFSLIIGLYYHGPKVFHNILAPRHLIRNFITIAAIGCVIMGLSQCAITQVDIITYMIPAFISLIATIFFGETFNKVNFILVGICISMFLARAGVSKTFPLILSGFLFALAEVWIRHKMHRDTLSEMLVSLGLTGSILLSYFFIPKLFLLNIKQLIMAILMGLGDIGILALITLRSKIGTSNDFLPLRYTSVIFSIIADKLFFSAKNIDYFSVVTIICASLLSIIYERFNKKNTIPPLPMEEIPANPQ
jgi:hypothetical protein